MLDRVLVNWPLKVLAVSLAFAIWVFVSGEKERVQDFSIPLDFQLPDHLALLETPDDVASVRLRGPESLMGRVDPRVMELSVALDDIGLGEHIVQLSKSDLSGVPRGVDVERIDPARLTVQVDDRDTRRFPLEIVFLGQPPEG